MTTGAYEDAIKAFENSDTIEITKESHYQKARCLLALNKPQECLEMLDRTLEICQKDVFLQVDVQVTQILLAEPCEAHINQLGDLIKLFRSGKLKNIKRKDAPLSISLVPNSERIAIEKQLVEQISNPRIKVGKEITKELHQLPIVLRYYESIYGLKDLYLYRGVIRSYLGKYSDAIQDFISYESCEAESSIEKSFENQELDVCTLKTESAFNILVCYLLQ